MLEKNTTCFYLLFFLYFYLCSSQQIILFVPFHFLCLFCCLESRTCFLFTVVYCDFCLYSRQPKKISVFCFAIFSYTKVGKKKNTQGRAQCVATGQGL